MSTDRLLSAIDKWIEQTIHDQSIGYAEAVEYVLAKMHNEAAQTKRQRMDYDRNLKHFTVSTEYKIAHLGSVERKSMIGVPHTEVLPYGDVKTGCIVFTRDAISKLHLLSSSEPGYVHHGYMQKGLDKKEGKS